MKYKIELTGINPFEDEVESFIDMHLMDVFSNVGDVRDNNSDLDTYRAIFIAESDLDDEDILESVTDVMQSEGIDGNCKVHAIDVSGFASSYADLHSTEDDYDKFGESTDEDDE